MNKISVREISKITHLIKTKNVLQDEEFDYLRVIGLNGVSYEKKADNTLFFLSYPTASEQTEGWYTINFDLRPSFREISSKFPEYTFVIEKGMESEVTDDSLKYIVVDNIRKTIDDIYSYVLGKSKAKVIAFTGSVGKTTAVGLLENILKERYNVLRIYSKRITPINLEANIINFLDDKVDYVVLENSLYYHHHVKTLSTLLKPEISSILNIESSHLGVEKLNSLDDICMFKAEIMRYSKDAYLNDNKYLNNIHMNNGTVMYGDTKLFRNDELSIHDVDLSRIETVDNSFVIDGCVSIRPFLLSNLSKTQYLTCYDIAKKCGISDEEFIHGASNYKPVENRLQKEIAFGKEIIFDGDVTTYERMNELSNVMMDDKYLVLRKVGSSENTFRINQIVDFFYRFKKVFIFSDIDYLEELKNEDNVIVVNNHDFMKDLNGLIIYHYSGYFRVWKEFLEDNLNIYDREKYIIQK